MRENAAILSGETLGELGFFGVIGYFIGFIVKTVVLYSVFTAFALLRNFLAYKGFRGDINLCRFDSCLLFSL